MMAHHGIGLAMLGLALASPAVPAKAGEAEPLRIELNRLEPREAGCRVWLVLGNPGEEALDPLRLDLVMFGRDGVIIRRLAVNAGPLPAAKTSVRIFDATGLPCTDVGSVLLNDILACGPAAEARQACLARAAVSSRAEGVPLEK